MILLVTASHATRSFEPTIRSIFFVSPKMGPRPCWPYVPSMISRQGLRCRFQSTTPSIRPFLWKSFFCVSTSRPFRFFMPRVTSVWSWVFMTGTVMIASASRTSSHVLIFLNTSPSSISTVQRAFSFCFRSMTGMPLSRSS